MKKIALIFSLFLLIGCKKDPITFCRTSIVHNTTNYDLKFDFYIDNGIDTSLLINNNVQQEILLECDDYYFDYKPFYKLYDSIIVSLDTEIVRIYKRNDTIRTIYDPENWIYIEKENNNECRRYQIIEDDLKF